MPVLQPLKNEKGKDFVARCMSDEKMKSEFKDNKQRLAVCYQTYKDLKEQKK